MPGLTTIEKIWQQHRIASDADGKDLLQIDRHYLTDMSGTVGLEDILAECRSVDVCSRTIAIPDHVIRTGEHALVDQAQDKRLVEGLRKMSQHFGIVHHGRETGRQGIVHVAALEQAMTLPGTTVVCGDSHTSTHGAVGALAWGIGSTEVKHVLATQTLWMLPFQQGRMRINGVMSSSVYAKDIALALIAQYGADFGLGFALEFCGDAVSVMSIEARATLCNMAVEMGARIGLVSPDTTTINYLRERVSADVISNFEAATRSWLNLKSDLDATYDLDLMFDISNVEPQITWGINLEQTIEIDGIVPEAHSETNSKAQDYMGLRAGQRIRGVPIDYVFIGSCANGRIEDLRAAATVAAQGRVASRVKALVVPGSQAVAKQAETEGLKEIFLKAGFDWGLPGCSMCVGVNGDVVPQGKRCISTSNRNFIGRQGPGARTHLASPATAAASALTGEIADPRRVLSSESEL
jgi:3-isopropylmalate/(R)-2-methylmalate dehydratase large subunit